MIALIIVSRVFFIGSGGLKKTLKLNLETLLLLFFVDLYVCRPTWYALFLFLFLLSGPVYIYLDLDLVSYKRR